MGAPVSQVKAAEESASAESLLESFKSIDAAERRRHATVLNYWLSIRGDKDVAPIRDLDPLEISDAGPHSLLLELIGGGEDAEIKHCGDALKAHVASDRLSDASRPSLLACVAGKLAIVAISRNFLAFEDEFSTDAGATRCWITLLPFSSTGVWVDYVYAFVSVEGEVSEEAVEAVAAEVEPLVEPIEAEAEVEAETAPEVETHDPPVIVEEDAEIPAENVAEDAEAPKEEAEPAAEAIESVPDMMEPETAADKRPGFSKLFDALAGFHGTSVKVEPTLPPLPAEDPVAIEPEPVSEPEPAPEPELESKPAVAEAPAPPAIQSAEGSLQSKLEEVRGKADEARQAKLRSNLALYEGLSAAYDFALDAEDSPEDYLRLVEAQGLKIQLRSPMTPVVKLAFDGLCDESTIGQLEAVLAWALKQDLPRGSLAGRIEAAGGIAPILSGQAEAA